MVWLDFLAIQFSYRLLVLAPYSILGPARRDSSLISQVELRLSFAPFVVLRYHIGSGCIVLITTIVPIFSHGLNLMSGYCANVHLLLCCWDSSEGSRLYILRTVQHIHQRQLCHLLANNEHQASATSITVNFCRRIYVCVVTRSGFGTS